MDNVSFLLDIKIIFLTIFNVLTNKDNENVGATLIKTEALEEKESV